MVLTCGRDDSVHWRICKWLCNHFLVENAIWLYTLSSHTSSNLSYHYIFYQLDICIVIIVLAHSSQIIIKYTMLFVVYSMQPIDSCIMFLLISAGLLRPLSAYSWDQTMNRQNQTTNKWLITIQFSKVIRSIDKWVWWML